MSKITHLDEAGAARMVDVSAKDVTEREAEAESTIVLSEEAFNAVMEGAAPKGDVLAAARIAGIMAAKKTSELIPLCHPIPISKAEVAFEPIAERFAIRITTRVKNAGQTGVEMEALTAASVAALTIYDMIKAVDRAAVIETVRLIAKSGGKSGVYRATPRSIAGTVKPNLTPSRARATPRTLVGEVSSPPTPQPAPQAGSAGTQREAFRKFMTNNRLRATEWAKQAGVSAAEIYSYLAGRSRALPSTVAEKLARAAEVRVEDMFR